MTAVDSGASIDPAYNYSRRVKSFCYAHADCADEKYPSHCDKQSGRCVNSLEIAGIQTDADKNESLLERNEAILHKNIKQTFSAFQECNQDTDCTYRGIHVCDKTTKTCVRGYSNKAYANNDDSITHSNYHRSFTYIPPPSDEQTSAHPQNTKLAMLIFFMFVLFGIYYIWS